MTAPEHRSSGAGRPPASRRAVGRARTWVRRAVLAGSAAAAYMLFESQWLKVSEQPLAVPDLPPALEGRTILHLSDVHAGQPGLNLWTFARAVRWAEERRPDLIVLTGDILGGRAGLTRCLRLLSRLQAPLGVYAVPGNHEYGISKNPLTHAPEPIPWESAGVTLLRDACVTVDVPADPRSAPCTLTVCGADYVSGGRPLLGDPAIAAAASTDAAAPAAAAPPSGAASTTDAAAAPAGAAPPPASAGGATETTAPSDLRLLLVHRPPAADDPLASRFHLAFAGHTHGGQIRVPTPWGLRSPHDEGFPRLEGVHPWGRGSLVISAGIGTTFLPFRLLTRPQAVVYRLKAANDHADDTASGGGGRGADSGAGGGADGGARGPEAGAKAEPATRTGAQAEPSGIYGGVGVHTDRGGGADANG